MSVRYENDNGKFLLDEETGLPELPEGYFWRVQWSRESRHLWYVQLRKRWIVGSLMERQASLYDDMTEETVLWLCTLVISKMRKEFGDEWWDRRKVEERLQRLTGDYPPAKLALPTEPLRSAVVDTEKRRRRVWTR